jgi:hypothetical protein
VCIIGTYIDTFVAAQFLKPHPDIGLDVFHKMANVNGAICIGQGGGYEYATGCRHVGTKEKLVLLLRHCIEERKFAKPQ